MNYALGTDSLVKMIQMGLFKVNQKPTVADMDLKPLHCMAASLHTYFFP